jgi:hypothetical protein
VELADGDVIILHDDCPSGWQPGDRAALLIHGLAGCHESRYMERIAHKLGARGVRSFRLDLRGCGAGVGLSRLPYHSGRSEDAAAAIGAVARLAPDSPVTLVGFSLGGNITLKLAGELADRSCGNLDSNRIYDRYFVRLLMRQIEGHRRLLPKAVAALFARPPRSLWEFDDAFTAVTCGFGTADNYYAKASSLPWLADIRLPTLIVSARDDPMIPPDALARASLPGCVRLHMSDHGGHLGFVGRGGQDADRRWMDWRVVDWVLAAGRRSSPPGVTIPATPR